MTERAGDAVNDAHDRVHDAAIDDHAGENERHVILEQRTEEHCQQAVLRKEMLHECARPCLRAMGLAATRNRAAGVSPAFHFSKTSNVKNDQARMTNSRIRHSARGA